MEKYVIFGPIIIFFGIFGLLILGFFLLIGKLVVKAKNDAWVGEVIDKGYNEKRKTNRKLKEYFYYYRVRLENGEEHNVATSVQQYNEIQIGDRMQKDKGSLWARKIV